MLDWDDEKAAVTTVLAFITTAQGRVPLHPPPLHPAKTEPAAGLAVNVPRVPPRLNEAEQTVPQSMPAGELATVPAPPPDLTIVRVASPGSVAVTLNEAA